MLESQQRLSALGLFRRVRITEAPHGTGEASRDVLVEVEEAPSTTISYGGGLEVGQRTRRTEAGTATERFEVAPRGFFEISRRNLWGKNRSVSLFTLGERAADRSRPATTGPTPRAGYGLNEYRVIGTFREPRVFGTHGDAQLTGFVERASARPSTSTVAACGQSTRAVSPIASWRWAATPTTSPSSSAATSPSTTSRSSTGSSRRCGCRRFSDR